MVGLKCNQTFFSFYLLYMRGFIKKTAKHISNKYFDIPLHAI